MRPQMMRPSELLRMVYSAQRDETDEIYPAILEPYKKDGRWMYRGIVTANVNAIIAVACYCERLAHNHNDSLFRDREEYRRRPLYPENVTTYIPHESVPIEWCIAGGV